MGCEVSESFLRCAGLWSLQLRSCSNSCRVGDDRKWTEKTPPILPCFDHIPTQKTLPTKIRIQTPVTTPGWLVGKVTHTFSVVHRAIAVGSSVSRPQNAERLWGQRNGVVLTNCINTVSFFTLDSCCSLWNGLPFWLHNFNRRALENVRVELDYGFVWDWSISKVAHAASLWIQSILREAIQSLLSLCLDLFPKSHDLFKNFWMSQQMPSKDVLFLHDLKSLA